MTDYCASKFGAVGLMEALRCEMKKMKRNITCTTICPYFINTGMFDGIRTSYITPLLDQDYVVWRIIIAVRQSEEVIVIPWIFCGLVNIANLLPVPIKDWLGWAIVGWDVMDQFKGRQN